MYIFATVALLMFTLDEAKEPVFQDETLIRNHNRNVFDDTKKAADNNWSAHQTTKNNDHRVFDSNYDAVVDETIGPASGDKWLTRSTQLFCNGSSNAIKLK